MPALTRTSGIERLVAKQRPRRLTCAGHGDGPGSRRDYPGGEYPDGVRSGLRRCRAVLLIPVVAVFAAACASGHGSKASSTASGGGRIVVFAAASLQDVFTQLAGGFEAAHPGVRVVTNFGGSDTLAEQILQGAPADVFASANEQIMQQVVAHNKASNPVTFARNELEIAVAPGNPRHIRSLADLASSAIRLALCAPTVPCGSAAAKLLQTAGVTVHPVTLEDDVSSVLAKVELGEVDAGLVYRTDVRRAGGKVDGVPIAQAGSAVNTYVLAVVTGSRNSALAAAFVAFVRNNEQVFADAGFDVP